MATRDKDEEDGIGKEQISLWLDKIVATKLSEKAKGLERSRSWLANHVLREALGLSFLGAKG